MDDTVMTYEELRIKAREVAFDTVIARLQTVYTEMQISPVYWTSHQFIGYFCKLCIPAAVEKVQQMTDEAERVFEQGGDFAEMGEADAMITCTTCGMPLWCDLGWDGMAVELGIHMKAFEENGSFMHLAPITPYCAYEVVKILETARYGKSQVRLDAITLGKAAIEILDRQVAGEMFEPKQLDLFSRGDVNGKVESLQADFERGERVSRKDHGS